MWAGSEVAPDVHPGRWEPGSQDSRAAKLKGPDLKWRRAFPMQMGARQPRLRAAKLMEPGLKWRRAFPRQPWNPASQDPEQPNSWGRI